MKIISQSIHRKTEGFTDIHDITGEVTNHLKASKIQEGQVTLFVVGSTAGLTTVEYEPGLVKDLKEFYEKVAPQNQYYHHEETWHDGNGFSHVRASLLKPDLVVPVVNGKMTLGSWQQIILIDFDNRPRDRQVTVQIFGE